ncbi:penicillin-binding protein activator [Geoalkalibacter halelectricus]|uniref:penicillin-binding protein activator n=1 Tax=Geoalkalibacter halelectricus TaxID=2847045 RepID=UPI003D199243
MHRLSPLVLLFFTLSLLWTAAPGAGPVSASQRDGDFQAGIELYHAGRLDESLTRLRGFVIRNPGSPLLPQAHEYLARIFHDRDDCDTALLYLDRLPPGELSPEARMVRGSCLVRLGEARAGAEILLPLQEAALTEAELALVFGRLGQAYAALDEPLRALLFYRQALSLEGGMQAWLAQVHALLRGPLSETVLAEAAFMFQGSAIAQDARLQLALRALNRGDRARAAELVAQVMNDPTPFPYRDQARGLFEQLHGGTPAETATLGAILPLSGRFAPFGERMRRGMELALSLHNQGSHQARFVYRDSGAEAETSADSVTTLVNMDRVMAIAGPLTGAAAHSAAQRAQREGAPLLTLSPREGLPQQGPWVFRTSLTHRQQARALAQYAVNGAGHRTFGVLFPENRLGEEMLALFAQEVQRLGGRVVRQQSYGEEVTDFRAQIHGLLGYDPSRAENREKKRPLPFDALFIPDFADRVGVIAPQLTYYGIENAPLLGINGWNSPELLRLGGRFVEGAVFVDGFFVDSPQPMVREFVALYRDAFDEDPTILEAQAFDSAGILLYLLSRADVRSREDLRRALSQLRNFPGVTGNLSVDPDGEIERELFLIRVSNGRLVQISEDRPLWMP